MKIVRSIAATPAPRAVLSLCLLCAIAAPARANLLEDLYQQALQSEPQYLAAIAGKRAALQQVPLLRAGMLPSVSIDGYAARLRDDTSTDQALIYRDERIYANTWQIGLRLEQPLLDWAVFARLQQIDETAARAELGLREARMQLLLSVAQHYLSWLGAADALQLAQRQRGSIAEQRRETQARLDTGYATQADVQQLIALHDAAAADELAMAARLRAAREAIIEVAERVPALPQILSEDLKPMPPQPTSPDIWVERALAHNLGLKRAALDVELAANQLQETRSGYLPQLRLELEHKLQDTEDLQLGRDAETSTALIRLHVPLFAGGATHARVQAGAYLHDRAVALLESERRAVVRMARDAYDGVVTGIEQVSAAQQSVRSSRAALDAVEGGHATGLRTVADVLEARKNLFQEERAVASARYAYVLSALRLKEVVGSLQDEDLLALDQMLER